MGGIVDRYLNPIECVWNFNRRFVRPANPVMTVASLTRNLAKQAIRRVVAMAGPQRWPLNKPRLWVLMYHRILPADDPRAATEEPGMMVTPSTFRRHLHWLRSEFDLVSLGDWVDRARRGKTLPLRACAITFDDGWRDNFEFALPILRETETPATIFTVSHMVGTEKMFWPNRVARVLRVPEVLAGCPSVGWLRELAPEPIDRKPTPDEISRVIAACKMLTDQELSERLDQIEKELGLGSWSERPLLNWDELRSMVESQLIEIGSHTCHHIRLNGAIDDQDTIREVVNSQSLLQERLDRPVRLFCYPNGDISLSALGLVQQHYDAAVTTRRGINSHTTSVHQLLRIGIHEDICRCQHDFLARLSGWI